MEIGPSNKNILFSYNLNLKNFKKVNEVVLSITNKSEIDLNVSLISFSLKSAFNSIETEPKKETDFRNLSNFVVNSEIAFNINENETIQIDRQDNSKTYSNALKETDLATNGFVSFRRDNKIGIVCKVIPLSEYINFKDDKFPPQIHVAFGLKHCLDQKAISDSSVTAQLQQQQQLSAQRNSVIQRVFINFGPIKVRN